MITAAILWIRMMIHWGQPIASSRKSYQTLPASLLLALKLRGSLENQRSYSLVFGYCWGIEFKSHQLSQYSSTTTIASVPSHASSHKGKNPVANAWQIITSVLPCVGQKNIHSCASTEDSVSETWKSSLARMYVLGRANVICSCSCSFCCSLSWLPCSPLKGTQDFSAMSGTWTTFVLMFVLSERRTCTNCHQRVFSNKPERNERNPNLFCSNFEILIWAIKY